MEMSYKTDKSYKKNKFNTFYIKIINIYKEKLLIK